MSTAVRGTPRSVDASAVTRGRAACSATSTAIRTSRAAVTGRATPTVRARVSPDTTPRAIAARASRDTARTRSAERRSPPPSARTRRAAVTTGRPTRRFRANSVNRGPRRRPPRTRTTRLRAVRRRTSVETRMGSPSTRGVTSTRTRSPVPGRTSETNRSGNFVPSPCVNRRRTRSRPRCAASSAPRASRRSRLTRRADETP